MTHWLKILMVHPILSKKSHKFKYFSKSPLSELTIYTSCFSQMQFEIAEILNLFFPMWFLPE